MTDTIATLLAIAISTATGLLGYYFQADVWTTVQMIFAENILILTVQIYYYVSGHDPYLGPGASHIRAYPQALSEVKEIVESSVKALARPSNFIHGKSIDFLKEVSASMAKLGDGVVDIDLRPGGAYFRELHAGDHAQRSYFATSVVHPTAYWEGKEGAVLLARNKVAVQNGVQIKRYFIHPGDRAIELEEAIRLNKAIGVQTFVVDSLLVNERLIRDFGICDDGAIGLELLLDDRKQPQRVRFYFQGAPQAEETINELRKVWEELSVFAQPC